MFLDGATGSAPDLFPLIVGFLEDRTGRRGSCARRYWLILSGFDKPDAWRLILLDETVGSAGVARSCVARPPLPTLNVQGVLDLPAHVSILAKFRTHNGHEWSFVRQVLGRGTSKILQDKTGHAETLNDIMCYGGRVIFIFVAKVEIQPFTLALEGDKYFLEPFQRRDLPHIL